MQCTKSNIQDLFNTYQLYYNFSKITHLHNIEFDYGIWVRLEGIENLEYILFEDINILNKI